MGWGLEVSGVLEMGGCPYGMWATTRQPAMWQTSLVNPSTTSPAVAWDVALSTQLLPPTPLADQIWVPGFSSPRLALEGGLFRHEVSASPLPPRSLALLPKVLSSVLDHWDPHIQAKGTG